MEYEAVIGLEVHAQLLTKSKIFCGCSTKFGAAPNYNTCPVCTGLPGVLPVLNRRVVEFALRAALATHCEIAPVSRWARKNYFYPDLPKGYQISMYESPLAQHGYIALVDLNRAGVPLLEIVSEPDIRTPEEAGTYLRGLRAILQYIEVCDGNMEEGSLRCDANVSVRPRGSTTLGTKVEVKNLNSFRAVEKALQYEIQRQSEMIDSGGRVVQETRLWDADREMTRSMRSKELAHDYRYFPDPDLLPLLVNPDWIDEVKTSLPELSAERRERLMREHSLLVYDAEILITRKDVADYYEAAVHAYPSDPKTISNWVMDSVLRVIKDEKLDTELRITKWPCPPEHLGALVCLINEGKISGKIAKTVFDEMRRSGKTPEAIVNEQGLTQVRDEGALGAHIDQVLTANPNKVADYRAGRDKLLQFFVGQVMKATQGKANPQMLNELLKKKLSAVSNKHSAPGCITGKS